MNFEWLNPALLAAGLAGIAIPLVLHLIHRRRGQRIRFSAVRFLDDTELPTARHLRLRDVLLFLLRAGVVAALALWIARPFASLPATASQLGEGPASVVLILDNSFSMGFEEEGASRFERAVLSANALIESLRDADRAALLTFVPDEAQILSLEEPREALIQALEKVRVSYTRPEPSAAITQALVLLAAEGGDRRIYVFSDAQRTGWTALGEIAEEQRVPVIFVDVREERASPNHAIVGASLDEDFSLQSSVQSVNIEVGGFDGVEAAEEPLVLYDGTEILSQGLVTPPLNGIEGKSLSYDAKRELTQRGRAEMDGDALAVDDVRYVVLRSQPPISVLVVDGDPRPVDYHSETFFLARALSPMRHAGSRVRAKVVQPEAFRNEALEDFDTIVLANVAAEDLAGGGWQDLREYAETGGGVFIALGDKVDPDEYNRLAEALLPARLRGKLDVSEKSFSQQAGQLHASRITQVDLLHPAMRLFGQGQSVDFSRASFRAYILTEPVGGRPAQMLLRFGNGAPALLEHRVGEGRVALWASSLDMDWGDFPIKPVFLPLVHQVLHYVSGTLREATSASYVVGDEVKITVPPGAESAEVELPDGSLMNLAVEPGEEKLPLVFDQTNRPGFYEVRWKRAGDAGTEARLLFAVNLVPAESDLRALSDEELSALLGLEVVGVDSGERDVSSGGSLFARERRAEFWRAAAFGFAAFLLLESLAGLRSGGRRR